MKASKEIRNWANKCRSRCGKKNGVIKWLWDDWRMEVKNENSKKNYKRGKTINPDE